MNWNNVLDNALGNGISDLIIGALITIIITTFFEKLKDKNTTTGALKIIDMEIQLNTHILEDMLNEMIAGFEKEMKRGQKDALIVDENTFSDAARFMRKSSDRLFFEAFKSGYIALGNMSNQNLVEKIINLYTVEYYYRVQTALGMEQLNWPLLDNIKVKLAEKIKISKNVSKAILKEIKIQRKRNLFLEVLNSKIF